MKEWLQVQNLVWYKKGIDAFVSCWHKTGCWWQLCRKRGV
jgi:hypothetical protein